MSLFQAGSYNINPTGPRAPPSSPVSASETSPSVLTHDDEYTYKDSNQDWPRAWHAASWERGKLRRWQQMEMAKIKKQ